METADLIEQHATKALDLIGRDGPTTGSEEETTLGNIRAFSHLSLYYADKLRGACQLAEGNRAEVAGHMQNAASHWKDYSRLMHSMFKGVRTQRSIENLEDWLSLDDKVEAETNRADLRR